MNSSDVIIDPAVAWLITGLLTILVIIVGFFGSKIYTKLETISDFVSQQKVKNEVNEDEHEVLWGKINTHETELKDHESRIIKLEVKK